MIVYSVLVLVVIVVITLIISRKAIIYWTKYWSNTLSNYNKDKCNNTKYKSDTFEIEILSSTDLPYINNQTTINKAEFYDLDLVPLFRINEKLVYHPVYIAQYALRMLDVYNSTKDTLYLNRVKIISDKLLGISIYTNSSLYFPYSYNAANHLDKYHKLDPPWYSGMAQGQVLSLFARNYEIVKEEKYLNVSHKIFNSFTKLKGDKYEPWTVCVDKNNYLWIEEFPSERPCFTLNGMIFGVYGVYDYYRITNSIEAKRILQATITTIKHNINKYRNKNDLSYYCQQNYPKFLHKLLKIPLLSDIAYHKIVIEQLMQLYKITNDRFFLTESCNFKSDTKNIKK